MTYYLLLKGDTEKDTIYETNVLGEVSFKVFYPSVGFIMLNRIAKDKPEILETAKILEALNTQWKIDVPKQKNVRAHQIDEKGVIITGNGVTAVKIGEDVLPFLGDVPILEKFPYVIVDMGAIKFVCKGANIMRPGITKFSDFEKGEIVCVIEESQHKFLAVGKAEIPSKQLDETKKGEVIKNMHYISDIFWESEKEIKY